MDAERQLERKRGVEQHIKYAQEHHQRHMIFLYAKRPNVSENSRSGSKARLLGQITEQLDHEPIDKRAHGGNAAVNFGEVFITGGVKA